MTGRPYQGRASSAREDEDTMIDDPAYHNTYDASTPGASRSACLTRAAVRCLCPRQRSGHGYHAPSGQVGAGGSPSISVRPAQAEQVRAWEDERRQLQRDLHDGLCGSLLGLALKLQTAQLLLPAGSPAGAALAEARTDLQGAIVEVRRLMAGLRPSTLETLGLVGAIQDQAARYRALGLSVLVEVPGQLPPLPDAVEEAVYRIIQEALTNIVRHAQATRCTVRLRVAGVLWLAIIDDGIGLPRERGQGMGLASMRERAAALGGTCVVKAAAGRGTSVFVCLPLELGSSSMAAMAR